jgi:hypothetical protein
MCCVRLVHGRRVPKSHSQPYQPGMAALKLLDTFEVRMKANSKATTAGYKSYVAKERDDEEDWTD